MNKEAIRSVCRPLFYWSDYIECSTTKILGDTKTVSLAIQENGYIFSYSIG